mmetsp:Transcript_13758/g.20433  ORF Transcript_13758/g.20433 Transcript_13758/m.20433 type:complete len:108 (+) Transcript_13758:4319-4642(+)
MPFQHSKIISFLVTAQSQKGRENNTPKPKEAPNLIIETHAFLVVLPKSYCRNKLFMMNNFTQKQNLTLCNFIILEVQPNSAYELLCVGLLCVTYFNTHSRKHQSQSE